VAEASAVLRALGPGAVPLAGGTDLVVQMQRGRATPSDVVSLARIGGLDTIREGDDGAVRLGAGLTHRRLEQSPAFRGPRIALAEAARVVGGHQIRNVGTLGGNVANASPAADTVPALLVMDARVILEGETGSRTLPLDAFLIGPGRTVRRPDEILTAIDLPGLPPRTGTAFLKGGRRRAMEISVVCVAARVALEADGITVHAAQLAAGAVGPTALRLDAAVAPLLGRAAAPDLLRRVGQAAAALVTPIDDVRASADYRRWLTAPLAARALATAVTRARAEAARA
jgi:carbon-monoxide dehydrogenase medium subunit